MESTQTILNKTTNYRTWSFRFLIYLISLNFLIAYIITTSTILKLEDSEKTTNNSDLILSIIVILTNIFLISGVMLTALSIVKKEKKDYKYIISIIGYSIFLIIAILSII